MYLSRYKILIRWKEGVADVDKENDLDWREWQQKELLLL